MPEKALKSSLSPSGEPPEAAPESFRRNAFWAPKTLEQLAAEQGVRLPQDLDALIGQGADLWDSNEDLECFLAGIAARRKPAAGPTP